MTDQPLHRGHCRCGSVRFEARVDPHHVSYCHCNDCRKATGAPVAAFVGFMAEDVIMNGDTLARHEMGPVTRRSCGNCGSPIAYSDSRIGDRIYIYLGIMDQPANYHPTLHAHVNAQLPFVHMPDGLPRYDGTSVPRPNGTAP
jgi:hypothetical protein